MTYTKMICSGALAFISLCTAAFSQPTFYGINCGSRLNYTSPQGDLFAADQEYSSINGYGYSGGESSPLGPYRSTDGTEGMDTLYFFWRDGDFSYLFDVDSGSYALNLYFCEKLFHWKDFRTFSVLAENDTLISDLDLFKQVNRQYALQLRYLVGCDDGQINVDFIPGIYWASLSAISVRRIVPDAEAPPPIQGFNTIGGYDMNILYWDYCVAPDLAGYRLYRRQAGEQWQLLTPGIHPQYRYFDHNVETGIEYEYAVTPEDLWGNASVPSDSLTATAAPQASTQLPRYIMEITEEDLYQLNINIWLDDYVPADLTLEGEYFPACSVRYRGSNVRPYPKKSYRLKMPPGVSHNGWDKFNLNSQRESTITKERLSFMTFDLLNCLSSATREIHLERNDEYIGVYLEVEPVDNDFLERRGLSPAGNLYKCESNLSLLPSYQAYQLAYPKVNNDPGSGWYDIIEFIEWINLSSDEEFHNELGDHFALDEYLDIYTVLIITQDVDFPGHNFFLYFNPVDERWYDIPWDHNETFDDPYSPINLGTQASPGAWGIYNVLLDRVLDDSLFRYVYCKKMERVLNDCFTIQEAEALVAAIHEEIYDDALRDTYKKGWERPDLFLSGPDSMNANIEERIPFLLGEIPGFITNPELAPYFRLNEIQSNNQTTIADEAGDYDPWIEITNLAAVELDLEGFILHYGSESWILPAEAVVDDHGFLLIWLDGEPGEGPLHSSFSLSPDTGTLILEGRQGSLADSVTFPALEYDQVWARVTDGIGDWAGNLPPTPGTTNNPPQDPFDLVINEFLAINDSFNVDPFGEYDDWVEIFNPSLDTIPLVGLYLTDDLSIPTQWAFPDTSILPESFILVWCDNDPWQGPIHAVFALSGDGEQVGLFYWDGITPIDTLTYGAQQPDISYGRYPDGADNWLQLYPTPEGPNILLGSLLIILTPYNPPIIIPETGGSFDFNIAVQNYNSAPQTFDLWAEITLPGVGSVPTLTATGLTIPGEATIDRDRTQQVPDFAPAGTYTYYAYVGSYPWVVDHYDSFTFVKEGSDWSGSLGPPSGWLCSGEPFSAYIETSNIPETYALNVPYPNPFNPLTTIRFGLPEDAFVKLTVYDLLGRQVAVLVNGWRDAGYHEVTFDGSNLASGFYFCRIEAGEFTAVRKMVLVK